MGDRPPSRRGLGGLVLPVVVLLLAGLLPAVAGAAPALAAALPRLRPGLIVTSSFPADGARGVGGTSPIVIRFSRPLAPSTVMPTIDPPVPGNWHESSRQLVFRPVGAYPPDAYVIVAVGAGSAGPRSLDGHVLAHPLVWSFETRQGSVLAAQQLLAEDGYLPVAFRPARHRALDRSGEELSAYSPQKGRFSWTFAAPAPLVAEFVPGTMTTLVKGAVMSFEQRQGLPVDGELSGAFWEALLSTPRQRAAASAPGFTYALASKAEPETLTIWHDGAVVLHTLANTGIAAAPTADGTYPVYEKLAAQIMKGVDPSGQKYADPVAFVDYFNGSDAVHYIDRGSFGYPQSLGCVEVPYAAAQTAYRYLSIGSLVTVAG